MVQTLIPEKGNLTTLQRIEQIGLQQILALTDGSTLDDAIRLHNQREALVNQYHNEQLISMAEKIINRKSWIQTLFNI